MTNKPNETPQSRHDDGLDATPVELQDDELDLSGGFMTMADDPIFKREPRPKGFMSMADDDF